MKSIFENKICSTNCAEKSMLLKWHWPHQQWARTGLYKSGINTRNPTRKNPTRLIALSPFLDLPSLKPSRVGQQYPQLVCPRPPRAPIPIMDRVFANALYRHIKDLQCTPSVRVPGPPVIVPSVYRPFVRQSKLQSVWKLNSVHVKSTISMFYCTTLPGNKIVVNTVCIFDKCHRWGSIAKTLRPLVPLFVTRLLLCYLR